MIATLAGARFLGDDVPELMIINFVLLCLIALKAALMIGVFVASGCSWRRLVHSMKAQQAETLRQQEQTARQQAESWAVLQIIKDYAESARTNRVEAAEAARESKDGHPSRAEIGAKIDAVPEATAARVVEVIKADSGTHGHG